MNELEAKTEPAAAPPQGAEIDAEIEAVIEEIVALDPHQLSAAEYRYVASLVGGGRGSKMLVFGTGNDSRLWLLANRRGRTVFLESSLWWTKQAQRRSPEAEIWHVGYDTRRDQWRSLLEGDPSRLALELPPTVASESWDVLFVDGPAGYDDRCPGRMKSIYTAALLARSGGAAEVVVHDCDRELERAYCDRFFHPSELVRSFERTRHYRIREDRETMR